MVKILRVTKEDSAFLYQLLEGYEGLACHSTLTTEKNLGYRDIEIQVVAGLEEEFELVLGLIQKSISIQVIG